MKIVVKSTTTEVEIRSAIEAMLMQDKKKKRFNTKLFSGKLNWDEDALVFQHRLRNEWD
jgi:hypothetical protein